MTFASAKVPALALLVFIGGCADRRLCSPELAAPVGQWNFTANGGGALMVNGLNHDPFSAFTSAGAVWPLVSERPGGYGLRFAEDSLASCLPEWAEVRIDGQTLALERAWSTLPEPICESLANCPPAQGTLDFKFKWTPQRAGSVHGEVEFGSFRRDLHFLVSEFASEPTLAVIPRYCRHVERVDSESWLCDRFLSRNGEIVSEWPNGTLVEHLGDAEFAAWKDDSLTFWSLSDGGLVRGASLDVGFPPTQRGSFLGRYGEDRLVVDGANRVAIAQHDGGWVTALEVPFEGDVAVVENSLLWVSRDAGTFQVCAGAGPGLNCESQKGVPFGFGDDGIWYSRTPYDVNLIAVRDVGFTTTSLVLGEMGTGSTLLQQGDTSETEAVFPRRQRGVGLGNTGSCLLFESEGDELRPVLLPENDFDEIDRAIGDGNNGLRWCTGSTRQKTYVYSAPRLH